MPNVPLRVFDRLVSGMRQFQPILSAAFFRLLRLASVSFPQLPAFLGLVRVGNRLPFQQHCHRDHGKGAATTAYYFCLGDRQV